MYLYFLPLFMPLRRFIFEIELQILGESENARNFARFLRQLSLTAMTCVNRISNELPTEEISHCSLK